MHYEIDGVTFSVLLFYSLHENKSHQSLVAIALGVLSKGTKFTLALRVVTVSALIIV